MTTEERFWSKVRKGAADECWEWTASTFGGGYGCFVFRGTLWKASRVAWVLTNGEISTAMVHSRKQGCKNVPCADLGHFKIQTMVVRHTCDNRLCVNPGHLKLGTPHENSRDMVERARQSKGDGHWTRQRPNDVLNGSRVGTHKLTEEQAREIKARFWKGRERTADGGVRNVGGRSRAKFAHEHPEREHAKSIGKDYGVSDTVVREIATSKRWKHLT